MKILKAIESRPYDIVCTDQFDTLKESIQNLYQPSSICIITDTHVQSFYLEIIKSLTDQIAPTCVHCIEAGEESKHIATVTSIYDTLLQHKLDRSSLIVALGGGVVGDIAGFVAATYMRGIPFVQVPTTVVSQNDSSIGGKVGVDYLQYKNIVGAFHNPILVYININTLKTLPTTELLGGMSEVIKHACIYNKDLFEYLMHYTEQILSLDNKTMQELTYSSCKVKCDVVEEDPKELGKRKILNFGHTVGHAIETLSQFKYSHGQSVAYGMIVATYISYKRHLITLEQVNQMITLCAKFNLLNPIACYSISDIWDLMIYDKKKAHGKVSFILLSDIGQTLIVTDIKKEEIEEGMIFLQKTCN